jgi:hypothetical protein
LGATLEEHHVDSGHSAAKVIRCSELSDHVAENHADGVGSPGDGKTEKCQRERVRQAEHDCCRAVRGNGPEQHNASPFNPFDRPYHDDARQHGAH